MWTPLLIALCLFAGLGSPCNSSSKPKPKKQKSKNCVSVFCGRSFEESSCDERIVRLEKGAFVACESDGNLGLTWLEVNECEVSLNFICSNNTISCSYRKCLKMLVCRCRHLMTSKHLMLTLMVTSLLMSGLRSLGAKKKDLCLNNLKQQTLLKINLWKWFLTFSEISLFIQNIFYKLIQKVLKSIQFQI